MVKFCQIKIWIPSGCTLMGDYHWVYDWPEKYWTINLLHGSRVINFHLSLSSFDFLSLNES
jgi:hypothetical protein